MMTYIDHGERCDRHIGEVFPPRCNACDLIAAETAILNTAVRYLPNSECSQHENYPLPCDRCKRDRLEELLEVTQ